MYRLMYVRMSVLQYFVFLVLWHLHCKGTEQDTKHCSQFKASKRQLILSQIAATLAQQYRFGLIGMVFSNIEMVTWGFYSHITKESHKSASSPQNIDGDIRSQESG